MSLKKTHLPLFTKEDLQGMTPIQGGLPAQDFHLVPQEEGIEMEKVEEEEEAEEAEEVEEVEREETQMIKAMAQS